MSPRSYNLGKRQTQVSQGRRQILDAARSLLAEASSYTAFTVDAVARRADVARATVYYQFGSKSALLEAVCDDLAGPGGMGLADAFAAKEPAESWRAFVAAFGRLWDADRLVMRRLRALAALDPDVAEVIAGRDRRRRQAIDALAGRLGPVEERGTTVRRLFALTSFETFDALAGPTQSLIAVAPDVTAMVLAVLGAAARPVGGQR